MSHYATEFDCTREVAYIILEIAYVILEMTYVLLTTAYLVLICFKLSLSETIRLVSKPAQNQVYNNSKPGNLCPISR